MLIFQKVFKMKKAQGILEYGLILAFVAIVAIAVLQLFSGTIGQVGKTTSNNINSTFTETQTNYCTSINKRFNTTTNACE